VFIGSLAISALEANAFPPKSLEKGFVLWLIVKGVLILRLQVLISAKRFYLGHQNH
jgi:hypothetical protein